MLNTKPFLCFDFGAGSVKVGEFVSNEAGTLTLTQFGVKALGQEGMQESKREAAVLKAVQELLSQKQYRGKNINVCAPGFHVFSKFVKLPPVDTSKVTQIIQQRIVMDIDELIKESKRQQQQGQASSQKSKAGEQQKPKPAEQKSQQQASKEPQKGEEAKATDSQAGLNIKDQKEADLSKNYEERAAEWGKLFDRRREAVMEGGGQNVIRKYRQFVDDYYRSLSEKASE